MVVIVKAFVEVELIELRLLVQISLFPSPWGITFEAPKVSEKEEAKTSPLND